MKKRWVLLEDELWVALSMIFLVSTVIVSMENNVLKKIKREYELCGGDFVKLSKQLREERDIAVREAVQLRKRMEGYENGTGSNPYPPLISISDDDLRSALFESGSHNLSEQFKNLLRQTVAPQLNTYFSDCPECNSVEIFGFTDTQRFDVTMRAERVNVDFMLQKFVLEGGNGYELIPASNADLGLLRAASVRDFLASERLIFASDKREISIRMYSGGALYNEDGSFAAYSNENNAYQRRIAIKVTKSLYAK